MNRQQARQFLNTKLQARVNEAKCKALIDDKLLANLFSQDIQQMHYETMHKKIEMAYVSKKLTVAHNKFLVTALEQYGKAIKSNKELLKTLNSQVNQLMDKEKDLLELREETILGVKEAMDVEVNSILDDDNKPTPPGEFDLTLTLPHTPVEEPSRKKELCFGDVIIKTIDEAEEEKDKRRDSQVTFCDQQNANDETHERQISFDEEVNDNNEIHSVQFII